MTAALESALALFGPPVLLAAAPGIVALCLRSPWLGSLQVVLAVLIVLLPVYLDALKSSRLESGFIVCSQWGLFEPWIRAVVCALVSGSALAIVSVYEHSSMSARS